MSRTPPNPAHADIPLPAGAVADNDSWQDWGNTFRVINTPDGRVSGHDSDVYGSALQFPDGHVDDGTLDPVDPPQVWIDGVVCLTTDQARQFAALIVATADEVDRWVGK